MNKEDKFYIDLGHNISSLRKRKRINQDEIGDLLKLSRPSIVNIEKGRQKLSIYMLVQLSKYFDVDLRELIPLDDSLDLNSMNIKGINQADLKSLEDFLKNLY